MAILKVYLIKRFILSDVQISVKLFAKLTVFDAERRRPNTYKCGTFYMKNRKKKVRIPRVLRVLNGCEVEVDRFGSFWKRIWFIFSSMRFRCWKNHTAPAPAPPPAPPKESDSTGCTSRQRGVRACDHDPAITIVWGVRGASELFIWCEGWCEGAAVSRWK